MTLKISYKYLVMIAIVTTQTTLGIIRYNQLLGFLEDHIKEGKTELNFSEWHSLSNRRKASKLRSIIKQIESDKMPLDSYTLIHSDGILTDSEKQEIIQFLTQLNENLN